MKYTEDQIRKEAEYRVFKRLITQYPSGVVSIVSDTFDFWNTISVVARKLKPEILARVPDQFGLAKVVFRPDSGDPVEIICGMEIPVIPSEYADTLEEAGAYAKDELVEREGEETAHGECGSSDVSGIFKFGDLYYKAKVEIEWNRHDKQYYYMDGSRLVSFEQVELTPEQKGAVTCLDEIFGTTTNDLGYKTLNARVGLIYGDSITPQRAEAILKRLQAKGYASDNIVFGVGSYTFQFQTRDSLGFAMKATYVVVNGVGKSIFKDPITDSGTKKSAKGLLCVGKDEKGDYMLFNDVSPESEKDGELQTVFLNGELTNPDTFENIRNRLATYL